MPIINTSAPSPGRQDYSMGLNAPKKEFVITEAVTLTQASPFVQLAQQLPPRCRIVWAAVNNQTAVNVTGAISGTTATGLIVAASAVGTGPAAGTASNATASAIFTQTTLSSNSVVRLTSPVAATVGVNTGTSPSAIVVFPYITNSNYINPSGTSGLVFGTSTATITGTTQGGIINVAIYVEQYDDVVGINY